MDEIIKFPTAKIAKEKGFQELTSKYYISTGVLITNYKDSNGNEDCSYSFDVDDFYENWNIHNLVVTRFNEMCFGCNSDNINYFIPYSAPTQTTLVKWLRETHKIFANVYTNRFGNFEYKVSRFNKLGELQSCNIKSNDNFEIALEECLIKALSLI